MALFKYPHKIYIVIIFVLILNFSRAQAKQNLDQPAILPSKALVHSFELNGIAPDYMIVSSDKRLFFTQVPHANHILQLTTLNNQNQLIPYPNLQWNTITPNHNHPTFTKLTGMTLEGDHFLWVLDNGLTTVKQPSLLENAKLIKIDLNRNKIIQIFTIPPNVLKKKTFLNAIAAYQNHVYLADKGEPAIIVIDLTTKQARRLLENSPTLYSRKPIIINNLLVRPNSDQDSQNNVNQLALSPDGKILYYQAMSGPLYRIDTVFLNDKSYTETELNEAMTLWLDTPTSGGITCGQDGSLYINDIATNSVYRFTSKRILTKLIMDPRLQWSTHPFVTKQNMLYLATLPFNPVPVLMENKPEPLFSAVHIYTLDLATAPNP